MRISILVFYACLINYSMFITNTHHELKIHSSKSKRFHRFQCSTEHVNGVYCPTHVCNDMIGGIKCKQNLLLASVPWEMHGMVTVYTSNINMRVTSINISPLLQFSEGFNTSHFLKLTNIISFLELLTRRSSPYQPLEHEPFGSLYKYMNIEVNVCDCDNCM